MRRSWRYSANPVDSDTLALDSVWKFNPGATRHTIIALAQYAKSEGEVLQYLGRSATSNTTDILPRLDILNPVYGGQPASTVLSLAVSMQSKFISRMYTRTPISVGLPLAGTPRTSIGKRHGGKRRPYTSLHCYGLGSLVNFYKGSARRAVHPADLHRVVARLQRRNEGRVA